MSRELLLGVDVGTTQIKAGLFGLDGRPLATASEGYRLSFDAATTAAEQDPGDWWTATVRALRRVLAGSSPHALLALSVGGQGPTVVALDGALKPVHPALTWLDRRANREWQVLSELSGQLLPPHAYVPKVIWLKSERPDVYAATAFFSQAWDFIAAQLIGELVATTAPGIAPWTGELLEAAGLDAAKFPPLRRFGSPIGRVTEAAARVTGLPAGLPVVGGTSDFFEGLLGSGAVQPGVACDNGGTSQSVNVCWDAPLKVEGVFCTPSFIEGYWYIGGPASTTGKALEWWREQVLGHLSEDWEILREVSSIPPGSERLIFLPYLAGERAPLWDPGARGIFFGLSLQHHRGHLTRAILESVAYTLCHLLERTESAGAQVHKIHVCGGQAASEIWCRIKADVTGRPVTVLEVPEAAVLGAAIIAGVGVGVFEDYTTGVQQMVRARAVIEPDRTHHTRYRALYEIYRELYLRVKPLYAQLGAID